MLYLYFYHLLHSSSLLGMLPISSSIHSVLWLLLLLLLLRLLWISFMLITLGIWLALIIILLCMMIVTTALVICTAAILFLKVHLLLLRENLYLMENITDFTLWLKVVTILMGLLRFNWMFIWLSWGLRWHYRNGLLFFIDLRLLNCYHIAFVFKFPLLHQLLINISFIREVHVWIKMVFM